MRSNNEGGAPGGGKLSFNGQHFGTLAGKDKIQVDANGKLTVNGKARL